MRYLLQVVLYTGVFWALYRIIAKDRLPAGLARAYLLLVVALPLVLPFVAWRWRVTAPVPRTVLAYLGRTLQEPVVHAVQPARAGAGLPWLTLLYAAVAVLLLLRQVTRYAAFSRQLRGLVCERYEGFRLYRSTGIGPASFGRSIYLPGGDAPEAILQHECAHLRQRHTLDLLALDLLRCLFWPNPFLPAIFRELKLVHEYAADAAAAAVTADYASVLLSNALPAGR